MEFDVTFTAMLFKTINAFSRTMQVNIYKLRSAENKRVPDSLQIEL